MMLKIGIDNVGRRGVVELESNRKISEANVKFHSFLPIGFNEMIKKG